MKSYKAIIWQMPVSSLVYILVGWIVSQQSRHFNPEMTVLVYLYMAIAATGIVASLIWGKYNSVEKVKREKSEGDTGDELASRFFNATLIRCALIELCGTLGIILTILTGDLIYCLILCLTSLIFKVHVAFLFGNQVEELYDE